MLWKSKEKTFELLTGFIISACVGGWGLGKWYDFKQRSSSDRQSTLSLLKGTTLVSLGTEMVIDMHELSAHLDEVESCRTSICCCNLVWWDMFPPSFPVLLAVALLPSRMTNVWISVFRSPPWDVHIYGYIKMIKSACLALLNWNMVGWHQNHFWRRWNISNSLELMGWKFSVIATTTNIFKPCATCFV